MRLRPRGEPRHLDEGVHASQKACERVLANYRKQSGDLDPPCLQSGCAETATLEANGAFFACQTKCGSTSLKCAKIAQETFKAAFSQCTNECRIDCKIVFNACLEAAGMHGDAITVCKKEQTVCTGVCLEGSGEYMIPDNRCDEP